MAKERTIEQRVDSLEKQVGIVATKVDMLVAESQQQREDIRRAQEKHDADMKELRQKHDSDIKEMNAKIDASLQTFTQQLHTNFVQTMMGVGAIMAAIGGLIIAALK